MGGREEVGKISEPDHSGIGSFVPRVELGIGETSAEGKCVFAVNPTGVNRRHPAILKNAGERALRSGRRTDVRSRVEHKVCVSRRIVPQVIHNCDARKNVRAERVDAHGLRSERLANGAVDLLANENNS